MLYYTIALIFIILSHYLYMDNLDGKILNLIADNENYLSEREKLEKKLHLASVAYVLLALCVFAGFIYWINNHYLDQIYKDFNMALPIFTRLLIGQKLLCCLFPALFPLFAVHYFFHKAENKYHEIYLVSFVFYLCAVQLAYNAPIEALIRSLGG